jgi:Saxitoxin biosynthesis operon protein SxtJ
MTHQNFNKVTTEQARKTCLLVAGALTAVATILWWRGRMNSAIVFGSVAAVLLLIGLFMPPPARLFHRAWMTFALALGYVNSRIILTIIYFLVFVPYGVVSRLVGRDPLQLREDGKESYWTRRQITRQSKEQFERLF